MLLHLCYIIALWALCMVEWHAFIFFENVHRHFQIVEVIAPPPSTKFSFWVCTHLQQLWTLLISSCMIITMSTLSKIFVLQYNPTLSPGLPNAHGILHFAVCRLSTTNLFNTNLTQGMTSHVTALIRASATPETISGIVEESGLCHIVRCPLLCTAGNAHQGCCGWLCGMPWIYLPHGSDNCREHTTHA